MGVGKGRFFIKSYVNNINFGKADKGGGVVGVITPIHKKWINVPFNINFMTNYFIQGEQQKKFQNVQLAFFVIVLYCQIHSGNETL